MSVEFTLTVGLELATSYVENAYGIHERTTNTITLAETTRVLQEIVTVLQGVDLIHAATVIEDANAIIGDIADVMSDLGWDLKR